MELGVLVLLDVDVLGSKSSLVLRFGHVFLVINSREVAVHGIALVRRDIHALHKTRGSAGSRLVRAPAACHLGLHLLDKLLYVVVVLVDFTVLGLFLILLSHLNCVKHSYLVALNSRSDFFRLVRFGCIRVLVSRITAVVKVSHRLSHWLNVIRDFRL